MAEFVRRCRECPRREPTEFRSTSLTAVLKSQHRHTLDTGHTSYERLDVDSEGKSLSTGVLPVVEPRRRT